MIARSIRDSPGNPATTIRYDLPEQAHVSLAIYDVLGREVAVLVNQVESSGYKSVNFDGSSLSSGVYLARFTATDGNGDVKLAKVMKLVLAK